MTLLYDEQRLADLVEYTEARSWAAHRAGFAAAAKVSRAPLAPNPDGSSLVYTALTHFPPEAMRCH